MLEGIRFNDPRFDSNDGNNILSPLTENTIILCCNCDVMYHLSEDIFNTVNNRVQQHDYACDDEDIGNAQYRIGFFLQRVIQINAQTITLCLEPAMVYKAKELDDIWFLDTKKIGDRYVEQIIPLKAYKGARELWEKGLDAVYKEIVIGRYGGYTGEWIEDSRKHTIFY
jgi:hypothetical protein